MSSQDSSQDRIADSLKDIVDLIPDKIVKASQSYRAGQSVPVYLGGNRGIVQAFAKTKIEGGSNFAVVKGANGDRYAIQGSQNQTVIQQTVINDRWESPELEPKQLLSKTGHLKVLFAKQTGSLFEVFVGGHVETPFKIYEIDLIEVGFLYYHQWDNDEQIFKRPDGLTGLGWMDDYLESGLTNTGKKDYDFIVTLSFFRRRTIIIEGDSEAQEGSKIKIKFDKDYGSDVVLLGGYKHKVNELSGGHCSHSIGGDTLLNINCLRVNDYTSDMSKTDSPEFHLKPYQGLFLSPFVTSFKVNYVWKYYAPYQPWLYSFPFVPGAYPTQIKAIVNGQELQFVDNIYFANSSIIYVGERYETNYENYAQLNYGHDPFNFSFTTNNLKFFVSFDWTMIQVPDNLGYQNDHGLPVVYHFPITSFIEYPILKSTSTNQNQFNVINYYVSRSDTDFEFGYILYSRNNSKRIFSQKFENDLAIPIDAKIYDLKKGLGLLFKPYFASHQIPIIENEEIPLDVYSVEENSNCFSIEKQTTFHPKGAYLSRQHYWHLLENISSDYREWDWLNPVNSNQYNKLKKQKYNVGNAGFSNGNLIGKVFYRENLWHNQVTFTVFSDDSGTIIDLAAISDLESERYDRKSYKDNTTKVIIWAFNVDKQIRLPDIKIEVKSLQIDSSDPSYTLLRSSFYPD